MSSPQPERPCAHCGELLPASARFCGRCGGINRDFFVSYNHNDQGWAEWIAWHLEAAGHTTLIQAWGIRPGSNFIVEMDQAFKSTRRTIAVLSPDYLASQYTTPEWADALRRDPTGAKRLLVPVRVRDCQPQGWLAAVVYIDLLGQSQQEARKRLLEGIQADGRSTVLPDLPLSGAPAYPAAVVALWHVPYRRNPYFSGRADLLEQVHSSFTRDAQARIITQAVNGLGGVGKTQTALEYAYRYQEEYQAVFWVQAETREHLLGEVAQLAALLKLPEQREPEQAVVVAAVRRWLEANPGWLLVLDNVEELKLVQDVLPTRGRGHVLVTTRAQALGGMEGSARVESLPPEEAMHLLLRRVRLLAPEAPLSAATPQQQQAARAIVKELGGLPLALDQAGAYIEETGCGLAGYLDVYRKHRQAALSRRGSSADDHPEAVGVTWAVSFEQVQRQSQTAVELLRLCAFLAPDGIPEGLFFAGEEEDEDEDAGEADEAAEEEVEEGTGEEDEYVLPPALRHAAGDAFQWNAALAALRRFSLLDRQAESGTLSLHRLVQGVVQEALPREERRTWAERAVRLISAVFPDVEYEQWGVCDVLLPHALVCARHIEEWHLVFPEATYLLSQVGSYLHQRARYAEALPLFKRALSIREQVLGPDHPHVAFSLSNLAALYHDQGHYAEALPLFKRALSIREQTLGPAHPDVAQSLNNLAELYRTQGQDGEALPLLERALSIREQALGPDHPLVANSLNSLAALYHDQGQYAQALPLFQRALKINEQTLGPDHPSVATSLNNLALLYYALGQFAQALPLLERALSIWEQALGPDHPHVARSLNSLAALYRAQGQAAEALPLLERALKIDEQTLGTAHPDVAQSLNSLALLYYALGQYAQALPLLERALKIREQTLGPDHPDVAQGLNNLAALCYAQGQYEEALTLFQRAFSILEQVYGPNHPEVASSLNNLAELYRAKGQYEEALPLLERALKIDEQALGPAHPDVATGLNNLAQLYQDQGQHAKALPLFQRALKIREQALGPDHPDVAASLNNLAALYRAQGQYAQALPLLERALKIWEQALGPDHPDVATVLGNLAVLLQEMGRTEDATPLSQRAQAIRARRGASS